MAPVINEHYPGLGKIPWVKIGNFPSGVEKLEEMGRAHGFPQLYIKRDDCCHPVYGGNKVRKLEYVLADAKAKNRGLLITVGATGSNQVLATGIHGGGQGFRVMGVMFHQPNAEYLRRNLLLDYHYGVEVKYTGGLAGEVLLLCYEYLKAAIRGDRPYYVPGGASSPVGNLGFVNAVYELKKQIDEGAVPEPDYIIAAAGSLGTTAGLELGCRLLRLKSRVLAVRVGMPWMVNPKALAGMVRSLCGYMRKYDLDVPEVGCTESDVTMLTDYLGTGYAYLTETGFNTVQDMKELEGIPVDPTYTGKALGGGLDWLRRRGEQDKVTLFWDTYNSVDLSGVCSQVDYRDLPAAFHRYFKEPTQEEQFTKNHQWGEVSATL